MSSAGSARSFPGAGMTRSPLVRRLLRDQFLLYTALIPPVAFMVALVDRSTFELALVATIAPLFIAAQAALGLVPTHRRKLSPPGWSLLRLAVPLLFVGVLVEEVGGPTLPLASLYLPVIVAAAALGTRQVMALVCAAAVIYLAPVLPNIGSPDAIALRGVALAGVAVLLAIATRRVFSRAQRTGAQLRGAMLAERRRSRQIAAMEAVGRVLVDAAPTGELLERALEVLSDRFGYGYVAVYLWDGQALRLGAQRHYTDAPELIPANRGVVGRSAATRQLIFLPDVTRDPDYLRAEPRVVSEICAPLIVDGALLGTLNVESVTVLDRTDRDLVAALAARIATVVALGRERRALAEREELFRSLHFFSETVSAGLDLDELSARIAASTPLVVAADLVTVTLLDRTTGRYLSRASWPDTGGPVGREIRPGEGLAGRAIRDRASVLDGEHDPGSGAHPANHGRVGDHLGAGIPLIRDGAVVGAITLARADASATFRPIELEAMRLLADHAALAVANAFLHAEVQELAIRDSLTGLHNRRYFDETIERMVARWRRERLGRSYPLSGIVFDLDHFGVFNKQHGHQVGDAVLRTFGEVLRVRFRQSDLVARFGGDEFVALLEGATLDEARAIADGVREALADRAVLGQDGTPLRVTVSAGCATLQDEEPTGEALLRSADVALFMAKRAGRDRVVAA
jgi:diguanylate cyclase (GGDEF)-like protein